MKTILAAILLATTVTLSAQVNMENGRFTDTEGNNFTGEYSAHVDGIKKSIMVENGVANGKVSFFYSNGDKQETGMYANGKKHGLWQRWNESGKLVAQASYNNGLKTGTWIVWDDSGVKRYEMYYVNGDKTGTWKMWDEQASLVNEKKY